MDSYADYAGDATAKVHAKRPATTTESRTSRHAPYPASPLKRPRSRGRSVTRKRPRKASSTSPQPHNPQSQSVRERLRQRSARSRSFSASDTPTQPEPSSNVTETQTHYPFYYSKRYFRLQLTNEVLPQLLPELPINAGADLKILRPGQKFPASRAAISNLYIELLEMRDLLWLESMVINQLLLNPSLDQILNTGPKTRARVSFWLKRASKVMTSIRMHSPNALDFARLTLFRFDAYPDYHPMHIIQDYFRPARCCIPVFKLSKDPLPFVRFEDILRTSTPDSDTESDDSDDSSEFEWELVHITTFEET